MGRAPGGHPVTGLHGAEALWTNHFHRQYWSLLVANLVAMPITQKTSARMPRISPAVALPEPAIRGFIAIIFLALSAFEIAIGPRIIPKQNSPIIPYVNASVASLHGIVASSSTRTGWPCRAITLHDAQYFCPRIRSEE